MPRRAPKKQPIETELFPFLSVLACTIGTLILLIIVMTTNLFTSKREVTIVAKSESQEEGQGKNNNKVPHYVECRGDGIVIHPSQKFVAKKELEATNSPLTQLLKEVKTKRDREYIIIAIRPDGIEIFDRVRSLIEAQDISLGYEPIEKDWKLKIEK
jgi:biopolymer transport protein ExbD